MNVVALENAVVDIRFIGITLFELIERCRGSAFITFSFGTITVRVLTLGVVSLRAIAKTLWLVPMISSNAANLVSASACSMSPRMALSACCMSSSADVFMCLFSSKGHTPS